MAERGHVPPWRRAGGGRDGHGHAQSGVRHPGHGDIAPGHGARLGNPADAPWDDSDSERRLLLALGLTAAFMLVEVAGGIYAGSLALLADAAHMLTDAGSLALAWIAFRLGRRAADPERTYGYHRAQMLAAFANGITLFVAVAWIAFEAVDRLLEPVPVMGTPMIAVATAGLVVNVLAWRILSGGRRGNLNLRGAAVHVLGDMLGSVAALAAAAIVLTTGWTPADPILSIVVAAVVLRAAVSIVRQSSHILLEGTPSGIDVQHLAADLKATVPGVLDIHHVHLWGLTPERPIITLHARIAVSTDPARVLADIKRRLSDDFSIAHSTVQLETGACVDDRLATAAGGAEPARPV
ncbi:MAG: cation diffusion facilitator family transporter [Alphaproteobacteria bacterium]